MWAVRLLYLQCAALAGLTIWLIVLDLTSAATNVGQAVALTVFAAIGVAAVFFVARALGRRARGARGPAIVIELFTIAAGGLLAQVDPVWLGVLLMVYGLFVGLLIVLPPSTRALGID